MSLFDAYIFIDWSAANRRSREQPSKNAVWIGALTRGSCQQSEKYCRTRREGISCVLSLLADHAERKRRVLVGFDFPYGYPSGFARALGFPPGPQSWWEIWVQLVRRVQDTADNVNNRFVVAAELNGMAGGRYPGPFWRCPVGCVIEDLPRYLPPFPFEAGGVSLPRFRLVEERLPGTQEAWKLFGAGSVGGQALVGIPYVHMLRTHRDAHCDLTGCSRVWPFETGFTESPSPDRGPFVLHAEIWPGVIEERTQELMKADRSAERIRDKAQVHAMCKWAAELDEQGELGRFFRKPEGLDLQPAETCIHEEGWILGAPGVRA